MTTSNFELILEQWVAGLKNKNRSAPSVEGNFEDLFEELQRANATFEVAHALLPRAIKAHQPSPSTARYCYRSLRDLNKTKSSSEKEFIDAWNKDIENKGTNAFFSIFPRPKDKDEEDDEPKIYGQMTVKEYKAQRRHADQYPILDTEELERKSLSGSYNPIEDIKNILGKKDNNGNNK